MTGKTPEPQLTFEHVYLTEPEATRLLEGHRLRRGERVMDPKAQIVGAVIRQLRPDLPPLWRTPLLAHAAKAVTSNWTGLR